MSRSPLFCRVQMFADDVLTSHDAQAKPGYAQQAHLSVATSDGRGRFTLTGTPAELHDVLARLRGELAVGERELRELSEPTEPEGDGS